MKVEITGASHFINRMFEACGPYQWAREFLKNSLEAGATQIEFGIEWQAVEKLGVYRRIIIDNGSGMSADDLLKFFSTLGEGAKKIGGIHDNFGVGAKIAALPWNPKGVLVLSYKQGKAAMIHMVLEPESGDYELMEFGVGEGRRSVIDPTTVDWNASGDDVDWSALRPDWMTDNGTIVVLLGSEPNPDTILGNGSADEQRIKGLSVYLNSRFWDLSKIDLKVVELRSEKKNQWPTGPGDRDDARRPNKRTILGARHFLTEVKASSGKPVANDVLFLDDERVAVEWYLWEGERPHVDSYAKMGGYIAVRYNDELFQINSGKVQFRWFGVVESKIQQNLTVILEPQHYKPDAGGWGVHPDQSRNRLLFTGDGEKGAEPPLHDWGLEFSQNMPEAILNAIMAARGEDGGTIKDDEYRKRLQDKFGNRWTIKQLVMVKPLAVVDASVAGTATTETADTKLDEKGVRPYSRRKRSKIFKQLVPKAYTGGDGVAVERDVPVDVPEYAFCGKEDFEKEWHIAMWDEASNKVWINREAPVLTESIKHHQEHYAEVYSEQVQDTVMQVFGEVAVSKVAHSQKLQKWLSDEELRNDYRTEAALTISLMGLLAEESLIAQRLGKFGRKKAA